MDPKFKLFSGGIFQILFGIFIFFQGCWGLARISDYVYSDYALSFYVFAAIVFVLSGGLVFWGFRRCRQNKLNFKTDLKTRIMTYAELTVTITGFSLFGIASYVLSIFDPSNPALSIGDINQRQIIHPYRSLSFGLYLLTSLFLFIALVMFYVFLPKQIAEEPPAEFSTVILQTGLS
jgi:hypothetical protein